LQGTLQYPTKAAVTIPIGRMIDLVSRIAQITRSSPKSQSWEQALEINPAVSREEKDELWCSVPSLHVAALELLFTIQQRLGENFIPLVPEALDQTVRILKSGIATPDIRSASYRLLSTILTLCGPSMSKEMVTMFDLALGACCRDLQEHVGFSKEFHNKPIQDPKKQAIATNVDLFLPTQVDNKSSVRLLARAHLATAESLLCAALNFAPQRHLKPALRAVLDQTAIITRNKDAILASVLNPYKDKRDRMYPSILPFLAQEFPRDQGLRSNVSDQASGAPTADGDKDNEEEDEENDDANPEEEEEEADKKMEDAEDTIPGANASISQPQPNQTTPSPLDPKPANGHSTPAIEQPPTANPFSYVARHDDSVNSSTTPLNPPTVTAPSQGTKRSAETDVQSSPKRLDLKPSAVQSAGNEASDSDDESVHLNMELDDDEDDEGGE
jgi:pre-rRNA-processing protein RIX1